MAKRTDIVIGIGGDNKDLVNKIQKANKSLKKFGKGALKQGKNLAKGFAVAGTAVTGLVVGLGAVANSATKAGDEINNLANFANMNSTEFQKWAYATNTVGVEQSNLAKIMKDTNRGIGQFLQDGKGKLLPFFDNVAKKVGVSAEQFRGLASDEALGLYVQTLEKANLSQSEMQFYMEALARDSSKLIPLLKNNASGLNSLKTEAEELGIILSEVDLAELAHGNKEFDKLYSILKHVKNLVGQALVPYFTTLINKFVDSAKEAGGFKNAVEAGVNYTIRGIASMADSLRGFKIAWAGLKLIIKGFSAAVVGVTELTMKAVAIMTDGVIKNINTVIRQLQKIPKIGDKIESISLMQDSDFMKGLHDLGKNTRESVTEARNELVALSNTALPSDGIEQYLQKVRKASKKAATQNVESNNTQTNTSAVVPEGSINNAADVFKHKWQPELDAFTNYQTVLAELKESYQLGEFESENAWKNAKLEAEKKYQDNLVAQFKDGYRAREAFAKMSTKNQINTVLGGMQEMTAGVASSSKKMFKINKAASIATAVMEGIKGAQTTFNSYPYPWNIPMTALHVAGSLKNIQKLKSAQYNGGGSGASAAPSASAGSSSAGSAGSSSNSSTNSERAPMGSVMRVEGVNTSSFYSGEQTQGLVKEIEQHVRAGGSVSWAS